MMECIVGKLQKQGVIITLFSLVLLYTGCEEHFDRSAVNPSEGEMVEVSLNIGFADEADGYDLSASTKAASSCTDAFDVELIPSIKTRATSLKPNSLYKLEIRQYKTDGTYLGGIDPTDRTIGTAFTASLTASQNCQLVFVAWGQNSSNKLGTGNLASAQAVVLDNTEINNLSPTNQTDMNKMPYVLHLKNVNITSGGKISSPDGEDVRVLLQRLATRLNISWSYNASGYTLSQIILQSIPLNYKVVAAPDATASNTYPSLLDQYTDIPLTAAEITQGYYSRWIPANVRGINTASNAPQYRIKRNAPLGSSYASFIAVNSTDSKKKLNYRVYLGGKEYSDYNLSENTDYSYTVRFAHTTLPVDDNRITIIDPIPASENNENFLPTANCFMVAPGGAFCFNPYKYYVNGAVTDNTLLQSWCASSKIKSVKVLWQTKENGDIGDPVIGVVNSATDHTNIVEITNADSFSNACIYCRVAPNTTGGSGVIAAYDAGGNILWSWHVWVTDYAPSPRGNEDVVSPENKRKQKYSRNGFPEQLPMMDRNLGAVTGYTTAPSSPLEVSKTNGFHYQWGRKDPFRSSYTVEIISNISVPVPNTAPVKNLLSFYQPDGISYYPVKIETNQVNYKTAYANPDKLYKKDGNITQWNSGDTDHATAWGESGRKGVHDPCPAGWFVCSIDNYKPLFTNTENTSLNLVNGAAPATEGGYQVIYNHTTFRTTYIRITGYWLGANSFSDIGRLGYYWPREKGNMMRLVLGQETSLRGSDYVKEAMPVRCIQDRQ